ncbi:hypothetical protein EDB83DRAFT_551127 [Lactarius deliciosus]|nr:hypothetical protein EDB83DRAFT_551127 [Lactarius deliciosus]
MLWLAWTRAASPFLFFARTCGTFQGRRRGAINSPLATICHKSSPSNRPRALQCNLLTDRVCFFSHCGTITIVWQAQGDLLNPERRAALSAGWACLEWSGTSRTAAHPGRGKVF